MAGLWYRAGTIAVTGGSKKVVGTGTTWKSGVSKPDKGHLVWGPDGKPYELDYVESDTVLYLVTAYSGVTATGMAYSIDITRTGAIPAFSRELSALVAYHQLQMDGWQQLLTGTGDVTLTAPDGSKLTVPTWDKVMNAGNGVVAQAKTEADRAKAEAANSAASAASAGNAVVAAALPLPDVWAPLSDSLRLITGYGREVKVGDDVVTRMVNFSRSTTATYIGKDGVLKSAAANEPRFEKEGLLIEGQSTNLRSQPLHLGSVVGATGESLSDTLGAINAAKYTITADAGLRLTFVCQPASSTSLTFSIKIHQSSSVRSGILLVRDHTAGANLDIVNFNLDTDSDSATCKKLGQWNCYTVTTTRFTSGSVPWVYFGATGSNSPGQTVGKFLVIGDCQVEPLPFASSYIPTSGAAASSGPDIATLPQSLNIGERQLGFSLAIEFDTVNPNGYRVLELSDISGILATGSSIALRHGSRAAEGINAPLGQRNRLAYTVAADGSITAAINGKLVSLQAATPGSSSGKASITLGNIWNGANTRPLFGHLRNLQIWTKKPLTADQLKVASA
ncbi:hypothetical protein SJR90_11920 [Aeromonas caviae]|uniref:phage head spike fiber domain-containing protein n=1 Tax=Aeromonas caviae TaxID=648 RepID=UPI0029DD00EE|nr:hypothetical protein [Aeromonas caviae]MDX7783045.1 hypothetical protein [Aeromonas caviae]